MKFFTIIFCFLVFSVHSTSAQIHNTKSTQGLLTDGTSDYWNPSSDILFKIFRKKYLSANRVDHYYEVVDFVLLVRLRRTHPRIAAYERAGRTNAADKLRRQIKETNQDYVTTMEKSYPGKEYYFYYAEEADEVFQGHSLKNLYSDLETRAADREIEDIAYVLSDQPLRISKEIALNLFIYDKGSSLKKVSKNDLQKTKSIFSSKYSAENSVENFVKRINKRR